MKIKIVTLMLAVIVIFSFTAVYGFEDGAYSVTNATSYVNPDTGKTEDGGTDLSIGNPMARSMTQEIMLYEVDGDKQYITIRIGLSSYTSDMRISVLDTENKDSGYQPVPFDVVKTNKETDTTEYKIEVDSLKVRIRLTFYVSPMNRDVIFFVTPDASTAAADNGDFAASDKVQVGYGAAFSGGNAEEGKMPVIVKDLTGVSEIKPDKQPASNSTSDGGEAAKPDNPEEAIQSDVNKAAAVEGDKDDSKVSKTETDAGADTKAAAKTDDDTDAKADGNANIDNIDDNEVNDSEESIETAAISEPATNNEDFPENEKSDEEIGLTQFDSEGNQVEQSPNPEISGNSYTMPIAIGVLVLAGIFYFMVRNNNQKKKRDSVK